MSRVGTARAARGPWARSCWPSCRRWGELAAAEPVDSMDLRLRRAGEWLIEKYGTTTYCWWRTRHLGVDSDTGRIAALALTDRDTAAAALTYRAGLGVLEWISAVVVSIHHDFKRSSSTAPGPDQ